MEPGKWQYNFVLKSFAIQHLKPLLFNPTNVQQRELFRSGALGTPVWDNLVLKNQEENAQVELRIDTVLIEAVRPRIIKKTLVTGRQGRIKEFISNDDWNISIRGVLFSDDKDDYPREKLAKLNELCRYEHSIVVVSDYLQQLLIWDIVVERLRLPQRAGKISAQAFEILASSDMPYELEMANAGNKSNDNSYSFNGV